MTFKDIEPNNIKVMESAIKNMLARVGVCNVDVKISSINIYDGREMAVVETSTFNTIPAIYRGIKVDGSTFIEKDDENDGNYHLRFHLNYRFDYWKGGENGVELGDVWFIIANGEKNQYVWNMGLTIGRNETQRKEDFDV